MKRTLALCAVLSTIISATTFATPEPAEQVRAAAIAFNDAYLRNDLDEYFGYYADDATLLFDTGRVAPETYRQEWYQLVEDGGRVESNVIADMQVQVGPSADAAIVSYQLEVRTRLPDGSVATEHAFETDVWFRAGDQWRVAHVNYTTRAPHQ
jgi:ketosteroid isomerase-like protein